MGYKIIFYKIFQNTFHIALRRHNRVISFEKCHVFTNLSPKTMFEETQMTCSLIMKAGTFMSYYVFIL